jgi:protein-ribulosamine 3-kinase
MITASRVAASASELLQEPIEGAAVQRLAGDSKWRIAARAGAAFVKAIEENALSPFSAEAEGLRELRDACAVRVPDIWAAGTAGRLSLIVLEWLDLRQTSAASDAVLGRQLAIQHRITAPQFGWSMENTLGASRQLNSWSDSWIEFFRDRRLGYQLDLAAANAGRPDAPWVDRGRLLCERLGELLRDHRPQPSLLHGDLWSGNRGATPDGRPVIFDPAVYFGDREADIAMTRLFGGFSSAFYSAYEASWPIDAGADTRSTLYNLYHVLNHFNLFGAGYLQEARNMIDELLAELGH